MRYTSLLQPMFRPPTRSRSIALWLIITLSAMAFSQTGEAEAESVWTTPARELVQQILDVAGAPSSVAYDVENRGGLAAADFQQVRRAIENEFRAAKVKVVPMDSAVAEFRFLLSRNARGLIWIAKVKQGTSEQVSMVEFADPLAGGSGVRASLFHLERTPLLARSAPVLDVAVGDNFLLVLGSEQITLYPRANVLASVAASATITHTRFWPRDLRGRIFLTGDAFTAYLPGVRCTGNVRPSLTAQCQESDDPWPLLRPPSGETAPAAFFSGARNHFSGVLSGALSGALAGSLAGSGVPPFFAAARLGDSADAMWAFSGTDGLTRLYIRMQQPIRTVTSLGSDLAAVQSECGARWQLLVTGDGDETRPDVLQAFEIRNREATAVSEKLSFDGPITALWSAEPGVVTAIVRNLGKESYEAYSVSLACR
ncbi:MAG: hypothetical protein ABIP81_04990 [Terriglobales bacterium]